MKVKAVALLVFLAFVSVSVSIRTAPVDAREEQPKAKGRVVFSDGLELEAEFFTTSGRKFRINDPKRKKIIEFAVNEIVYLKQEIEDQSMEKKWVFKELGTEEKIKKEVEYPVRIYLTEVKLKDGTVIKGHVIAALLYVRTDKDKVKYKLLRQEKGDVGQKLDDLVYIKELRIDSDPAGNEYAGRIAGKLKVVDKVLEVYAVSHKVDKAFAGKVDDLAGTYEITNLPEGVFDVVYIVKGRIVFGLSVSDEQQAKKPLDEKDVKAVNKRVQDSLKNAEPFYDHITVPKLLGGRSGPQKKAARLFLAKGRDRPSTYDGLTGRAHDIRRYVYWLMSEFDKAWVIDKRIHVTRQMIEEDSGEKPYAPEWSEKLSGLEVKKNSTLKLDLE